MIERDNFGDDREAPRFKKVFLLDTSQSRGGYVGKTLLLDLLAIPDPGGLGKDGDFFGRARSRNADRSGPLSADDTEIVLVRLGAPLDVDKRLLPHSGLENFTPKGGTDSRNRFHPPASSAPNEHAFMASRRGSTSRTFLWRRVAWRIQKPNSPDTLRH